MQNVIFSRSRPSQTNCLILIIINGMARGPPTCGGAGSAPSAPARSARLRGGSARSARLRGGSARSARLSAGWGSLTAGGQKALLSIALDSSNVSSLSGLPPVPVAACWAASPDPVPSLSRLMTSLLSQLTHTGRLYYLTGECGAALVLLTLTNVTNVTDLHRSS